MSDSSDMGLGVNTHLDWIKQARNEAEQVRMDARTVASGSSIHQGSLSLDREAGFWAELTPRYEISDESKRGGQGVVYRGTQRGTRRDVAIKVMREGPLADMSTKARFDREVQILAQLKHPNIVTILDSGVASDISYYVMDYIHGDALDTYVHNKNASVRETLTLFAKICDAVNAGHLRGIIHRDLKPSNIRVDRAGEPHVLDFGLAKVSEFDDIADSRTIMRTTTGQFVGSLPWASPEQVEGRPEGIDIRTDVYAIGVMLYQMLTGRFPYEVDASMREVLENICTADPRKPSTLNPRIDDEVDQIVLKCLRKSADFRYQSAGNLGREIRRYLAGEPIEAKGDSGWYVVRKKLKQHRVPVTIAGLIAAFVAFSAVAFAFQYQKEKKLRNDAEVARKDAESARDEARDALTEAERQATIAEQINNFLNYGLIAAAMPDRLGKDVTLRAAVDSAAEMLADETPDDPEIAGQIYFTLGETYLALSEYEKSAENYQIARKFFEEAHGPAGKGTIGSLNDLARVYIKQGRFKEALAILEDCVERRIANLGRDHTDTLTSIANLGWTYYEVERIDEAIELLTEVYEKRLADYGAESQDTLTAANNLGIVLYKAGQYERAGEILESAYETQLKMHGPDHASTVFALNQVALIRSAEGNHAEAAEIYESVLAARKKILGPSHYSTVLTTNNLALCYVKLDRMDRTIELLREGIENSAELLQPGSPIVLSMKSNLGEMLRRTDRFAEALPLAEAAVAGVTESRGPDHTYTMLYRLRLGRIQFELDQFEAAEENLLAAYEALSKSLGESHEFAINGRAGLIEMYEAWDKPSEAAKWRELHSRLANDE